MIYPENLHTHCTHCDGSDTAEVFIEEALRLGLTCLGFSSHGDELICGSDFGLKPGYKEYTEHISALKNQYAGKLDILMGIEQDIFSPELPEGLFDYVIGSVHYVCKDGVYLPIDSPRGCAEKNINEHYNGDWLAYVQAFYDLAAVCAEKTKADIVGHFDMIGKFNDNDTYFPETSSDYYDIAIEALKKAVSYGKPFEVNTGGLSRGYTSRVYPAPVLLKELYRMGAEIVITSDAHHAKYLTYGFDFALKTAYECGFRYVKFLSSKGFRDIAIEI